MNLTFLYGSVSSTALGSAAPWKAGLYQSTYTLVLWPSQQLAATTFSDFSGKNIQYYGGVAADTVRTGSGRDLLDGGAGSGIDRLSAGGNNDTVYGRTGNDFLFGEDGDDFLYGGLGNDELFGGAGDDRIYDDRDPGVTGRVNGVDLIEGGSGNDVIFLSADGAVDVVSGGGNGPGFATDSDTLVLEGAQSGSIRRMASSFTGDFFLYWRDAQGGGQIDRVMNDVEGVIDGSGQHIRWNDVPLLDM